MIAAAFGYITPVQGALLQEMIDVAVILNALRALKFVPKETDPQQLPPTIVLSSSRRRRWRNLGEPRKFPSDVKEKNSPVGCNVPPQLS
jgi:hypothetical protein